MNTGTRTDWLSDRVLRGLIHTAKTLPYAQRVAFMGGLTRRVIGPVAGYRKRSITHLGDIWPELDHSARRRIANAVNDNVGRTLIENYSGKEFASHLAQTNANGAGLAALAQAKEQGRPVLFVTGHFGNYEAPRQVLTRMGYTIGGLYKPMSNPFFNEHYVRTMQDVSGPVFEKGHKGTMGFARYLKRGGMATLLFDVADTSAEPIPFLGKPAMTSFSAATLALRFDALLIPYFGRRKHGIYFDITVEAPIPHTDPRSMTIEMTKRLEHKIQQDPDQWFWVHRRWKPAGKIG